jgi:hypothetical protein
MMQPNDVRGAIALFCFLALDLIAIIWPRMFVPFTRMGLRIFGRGVGAGFITEDDSDEEISKKLRKYYIACFIMGTVLLVALFKGYVHG